MNTLLTLLNCQSGIRSEPSAVMSSNGDGDDDGKLYGPFRYGDLDSMVGKVISSLP